MNIVVCLKQVPGTIDVRIDPETNTLIRAGIEAVANPFDTYALEEGVRLKERLGGKVTAISMGPPQAENMLREAISTGADEAVLLSDGAFAGADTLSTSYTLAQAIKKLGQFDFIICGRQTLDGDTGQVAPELAEVLKLPFVAYVSKIEEINEKMIRVQRLVEEGHEIIEAPLPAVITVVKEINVPRLPSLRRLSKAKNATIPTWTYEDLGINKDKTGMAGSATKVVKVFVPPRAGKGELLTGETEDQVDSLITRLRGQNIV